ncbi:L,D-transpeptidase [Pseudoruegeria sp. SHC-113]|uniref:L,D-transpeptidase n=1 Tax=Pseudoruegeria sp. SHC-113 TaxID=2855439 RepID=UPI0021BAA41A|nr:L,D-transpeptidase [Pseudoruegeria sp. SHC-113]MCT8159746.1 L,D-transpeptidase [Pseudoruegeria sp. SHC-113]
MKRRTFLAATLASSAALTAPALGQNTGQKQPFVLPEQFKPQYVTIKKDYAPGQILIVPQTHFLYHVVEPQKAVRYGVGVGRAGLAFKGRATIDVKKEWPTWRPTQEMIERDPQTYGRFADNDEVQPGGPGNPLGARALYLFQNGVNTFYAIHGTTQPSSIGRSVSNGCIRMLNSHVIHLYDNVPVGTVVTVL